MHKNQAHSLNSILPHLPGLVALIFLFLLAGCTKQEAPIMAARDTGPAGISLTPTESPDLTSTSDPNTGSGAPRVSPYVDVDVQSVEFHYLDTSPVQVELVILGTLPDQCKYGFYSLETRVDQVVRIKLRGIHPADTNCGQTRQSMEYTLLLGGKKPESERGFAPGDYELIVNGYKTTFSIKK
jgi:hypothetical protein